jgi:hypothetical protein
LPTIVRREVLRSRGKLTIVFPGSYGIASQAIYPSKKTKMSNYI